MPAGNYTETQPVTFYTEHLERKNFYQSASVGLNPFARTCGLTQPVQRTRAVANYEGNVNFAHETQTFAKLGETRDLYKANPYQSYPKRQIYNHDDLKCIFLEMSRDYTFGLRQIRKFINDFDVNKNGCLDPEEFREVMRQLGLGLVPPFCLMISP